MEKTEQVLVAPKVLGGTQIQVHDLKLSNYNLKTVLTSAADLIKGLLECDSANSNAQFSPNDQEMLALAWSRVKVEWGLAQDWKEMAKGRHEREHWITVPTDNEVATCNNIQCQRICEALLNLIYIGLGTDSAAMQFWLGPKIGRDFVKAIGHVDAIILAYTGDNEMPEFATGTLVPQTDLGSVNLREAATEQPDVGVPDAADRPSIAPSPGDRQT